MPLATLGQYPRLNAIDTSVNIDLIDSGNTAVHGALYFKNDTKRMYIGDYDGNLQLLGAMSRFKVKIGIAEQAIENEGTIEFSASDLLAVNFNASKVEYSIDTSTGTDGQVIGLVSGAPVWTSLPAGWKLSGNDINETTDYLGTNNDQDLAFKRFGIQVQRFYDYGTVVFSGDNSSTVDTPAVTGAGSRMMFSPRLRSFWVGGVSATKWDSWYSYTLNLGYNSQTTGTRGIAIGSESTAAAFGLALGPYQATAAADSIAIGGSLTFGAMNVSGAASIGIGTGTVSGQNAIYIGRNGTSLGNYTLNLGNNNTANATYAMTIGRWVHANAKLGGLTIADGSTTANFNAGLDYQMKVKMVGGYLFNTDYAVSAFEIRGTDARAKFHALTNDNLLTKVLVADANGWLYYRDASSIGSVYTDEQAQDAVGYILGDTETIQWTYDDVTPFIIADVKSTMSIISDGAGLQLVNDNASPGGNMLYGTNGGGVKGWYSLPSIPSIPWSDKLISFGRASVSNISYDSSLSYDYDNFALTLGSRNAGGLGYRSTAFGVLNVVSGQNAMAVGDQNTVSGYASNAFGYLNQSTGNYTNTWGRQNQATADYSLAMGAINTATNIYAVAIGYQNDVSGQYSTAHGNNNLLTANFTYTLGSTNRNDGIRSITIGTRVHSNGKVRGLTMGDGYTVSPDFVYAEDDGGFLSMFRGGHKFQVSLGNTAVGINNTGNLYLNYVANDNALDQMVVRDPSTGIIKYRSASTIGGTYTDTDARNAVGGILVDSDTIDFTYNAGVPSITAAARYQMSITSDAAGLKLVNDNTSPGANMFYGTSGVGAKGWQAMPTITDDWHTTGNAFRPAGTYFIGTTDAEDFLVKREDIDVARFFENGTFILYGNSLATTESNPLTGAGARFTYLGGRSAIMAGFVNGTQWDIPGYGSANFGINSKTTGNQTFAAGAWHDLSGNYSSGIGTTNTVSGSYSHAIGTALNITADYAIALGSTSSVSGTRAGSIGYNNTIQSQFSYIVGNSNTINGEYSQIMGYGNSITIGNSYSVGYQNNISTGSNSYSFGRDNVNNSIRSFTIGTRAHSNGKARGMTIADGTGSATYVYADVDYQFKAKFAGGFTFWTDFGVKVGSILSDGIYQHVISNDDTLNQVVVRDPSTGLFKYRAAATLAGGGYTDADAQNAVGGILIDSNTIDFTYNSGVPSITGDVRHQMSITSDASGLKLSGDSASPGNNMLYGTNGSGVKGWYSTPSIPLAWLLGGNTGTNPTSNWVGTSDPTDLSVRRNSTEMMRLYTDTVVFAGGATATTQTPPVTGAGVRTMLMQKSAAFRTGGVSGTQWDVIGLASFASGYNNIASGTYSFSAGNGNTSSGSVTITLGQSNVASSDFAIGIGSSNTVTGSAAVGIGNNNTVSGLASMAIAYAGQSTGLASVAVGFGVIANADYAHAYGNYVNTNGKTGAMILGDSTASYLLSSANNEYTARFASFRFFTDNTNKRVSIDPSGLYIHTLANDNALDRILVQDNATGLVKYRTLASMGGGSVTSITAGNGMSFSTITTSGPVTLGTPSSITLISTNSTAVGTHTHAFAPGGTSGQYIAGNGTLITFPTIPLQYWQQNTGVLSPSTITDKLSIGTTANTGDAIQTRHDGATSYPLVMRNDTTVANSYMAFFEGANAVSYIQSAKLSSSDWRTYIHGRDKVSLSVINVSTRIFPFTANSDGSLVAPYITTNNALTDVLVADGSGNIRRRAVSTIGGGTVTSVGASISGALSVSGSPIITSGTLAFTWTGSNGQTVLGDGSLITTPDPWLKGGNGGTAPGTHFIGTTDNNDLVYKRYGDITQRTYLYGTNVWYHNDNSITTETIPGIGDTKRRMMLLVAKSSFVVGSGSGTKWDNVAFGVGSIGINNEVTANNAMAFGSNITSTGASSGAMAATATVSGNNAYVMGSVLTADAAYAFVFGRRASSAGFLGGFTFSDGNTPSTFSADTNYALKLRFEGGYKFLTDNTTRQFGITTAGVFIDTLANDNALDRILVQDGTTKQIKYRTAASIGGGGAVTSVAASISGALSVSGSPITTTGTLAFSWTGTNGQYVRGDGSLVTFPVLPTQYWQDTTFDSRNVLTTAAAYSNHGLRIIGPTALNAGFSTYVNEGVWGSTATPFRVILPNGNAEIRGGYLSGGDGNYYPVIGIFNPQGRRVRLGQQGANGAFILSGFNDSNSSEDSIMVGFRNGNVAIGPGFNDGSTVSNTLDVNGTARIRSISNDNSLNSLLVIDANGVIKYRTAASLGGGTPAPSDKYIQYNASSAFGASQYLQFDYSNNSLLHGQRSGTVGTGSSILSSFTNGAYVTIVSGSYAAAYNSYGHTVTGDYSAAFGGYRSSISSPFSYIIGGYENTIQGSGNRNMIINSRIGNIYPSVNDSMIINSIGANNIYSNGVVIINGREVEAYDLGDNVTIIGLWAADVYGTIGEPITNSLFVPNLHIRELPPGAGDDNDVLVRGGAAYTERTKFRKAGFNSGPAFFSLSATGSVNLVANKTNILTVSNTITATVVLPASPNVGDIVTLRVHRSSGTTSLIISRNGNYIDFVAADQSVTGINTSRAFEWHFTGTGSSAGWQTIIRNQTV